MKLRTLLIGLLALVLLCGCGQTGPDAAQTTPTAGPVPTATTAPTPTPEPGDREEPETFTYYVEGEENTVTAMRHYSPLGYSMVYDPDIMYLSPGENGNQYIAKMEGGYTDVYIRVDKDPRGVAELAGLLLDEGAEDYGYEYPGGCPARMLYRIIGDAEGFEEHIAHYYLVRATEGTFVIECYFFTEAAEGFGARMFQMIETIRFTDAPHTTTLDLLFRDAVMKDFTTAVGESTTLRAGIDPGSYIGELQWVSSDESVCSLVPMDGYCYVIAEGEGTATVTATRGELSASTIVRCIESW